MLTKLHTVPAPKEQEDWEPRFNRKIDTKIRKYKECGIRFPGDSMILDYIEENRVLLAGRPQTFQHGDYHIGNMIVSPEGRLFVIDFNRFDYGDPWEEFNRIVWCAAASPAFAGGRIDGYFEGMPPIEFFRLLALYIASNTLSSIYWAIPFGQGEIDTMMKQAKNVLDWFDGMNDPVPEWYRTAALSNK
jgi:serine/threonine-protein kinase